GEHSPRPLRPRRACVQSIRRDRRLPRLRRAIPPLRGPAYRWARARDRRARRDAATAARIAYARRLDAGGRDPAARYGKRRGPAMRAGSGWRLLAPALLLLAIAFVLPVGMLVPTSVRPYVPLVGITSGFTLRHYTKLLNDSYYLEIIGRTLALGLTVTGATLVIGYPVAFFLARTRSRGRNWLAILVVFPLLLNLCGRTFGWMAVSCCS